MMIRIIMIMMIITMIIGESQTAGPSHNIPDTIIMMIIMMILIMMMMMMMWTMMRTTLMNDDIYDVNYG